MNRILKNELVNGEYYFFGDFKYQGLVTAGSSLTNKNLEERKPENNLRPVLHHQGG